MQPLSVELLLGAYAVGIFPMANDYDDPTLYWIEPRRRGVLPLDAFHVPRRLGRSLRRTAPVLRVDSAFEAVVRACAEPVPERPRTWLNPGLVALYVELHRAGHAHSVEVWQEEHLVGGLYGVQLGGAFFGESMFSRARDASKMALVELVGRLRAGGFVLLDTQFVTEHLQRFGAVEIGRADYLERLRAALPVEARFPAQPYPFWPSVVGGGGFGCGAGPKPGSVSDSGSGSGSRGSSHSITQTS